MPSADKIELADRASELRAELQKPVILPEFPQEEDFKAASWRQLLLRLEFLHLSVEFSPATNMKDGLAILDNAFPSATTFAKPKKRRRPKLDGLDILKLLEFAASSELTTETDVCEAFAKTPHAKKNFKLALAKGTLRRNLSDIKKMLRFEVDPDSLNSIQREVLFFTTCYVEARWLGVPIEAQAGQSERIAVYRTGYDARKAGGLWAIEAFTDPGRVVVFALLLISATFKKSTGKT